MSPFVSVLLPVFNAEKFVEKAIQSILDQTYVDFELIVINDGSTDGTLEILERLKCFDERVSLVSRDNCGLVETLNYGISIARGYWIARMDADDIALPNRIERQLEWLNETGADICGSWVQLFGTADSRIIRHPKSDDAIKFELLFGSPFSHPSVMMKAESVNCLRYDKAWEKCEDYDLWERAARAGWQMTNVQEVLLLYRQHSGQITTQYSSKNLRLSSEIKRRYLQFVLESYKLPINTIDEILKIRDEPSPNPDMDAVDAVFDSLLIRSNGESREIVLDHLTRLYYRVAANCPTIVSRWSKFNACYSDKSAYGVKFKLLILRTFRIGPNSILYNLLKIISIIFRSHRDR